MNKIRRLSLLILLALLCSSICWSQSVVSPSAHRWSQGNTQPPQEAKYGKGAPGLWHP